MTVLLPVLPVCALPAFLYINKYDFFSFKYIKFMSNSNRHAVLSLNWQCLPKLLQRKKGLAVKTED